MNMHAFFDHAGSPPVVLGMLVALVLVAALVNRFRPSRRPLIRRSVLFYALYVGSALISAVAMSRLGPHLQTAVDLLQAWSLVSLFSILLFELLLPALGLSVVDLTSDLLTGAAYFFVAFGVLGAAGLDVTSLLAASTVAGVVLTLSLQSTLGNVIGGLALQLEGSIRVGDWIQLEGGRQGRVARIRWRHTTLETRDWDTIVVPNAVLLSSQFTLLGQRAGRTVPHRQWILLHVDFRFAPSHVVQVVEEALRAAPIPDIASDPPPDCVCADLARDGHASYAVYAVRYWLTDLARDVPTDSLVRGRVHAALRRAGIPLARPSSTYFQHTEDPESLARREGSRQQRGLETLQAVGFFASLTDEERTHLASRLVYSPFDTGETITRQGATAHWLYLIHSGSVEVRTTVDGVDTRVVRRLEAPDFFGEMGLMTGEPRLASVVALTPVVCYRLDKDAFQRVLTERPPLAAVLSRVLATRRVELIGVREGLDEEARLRRMATEQRQILERVRHFFGLG